MGKKLISPRNINRLYQKLAKNLSEAKSELVFKNHYELLISVILSAQSTDKTVNKVTSALFSSCPTPAKMLALGQSKLAKIIKPIGLAPAKSKNIINTCKILLEKHNGRVPGNRKDLENLPGVGRKTANVVLKTYNRCRYPCFSSSKPHGISTRKICLRNGTKTFRGDT